MKGQAGKSPPNKPSQAFNLPLKIPEDRCGQAALARLSPNRTPVSTSPRITYLGFAAAPPTAIFRPARGKLRVNRTHNNTPVLGHRGHLPCSYSDGSIHDDPHGDPPCVARWVNALVYVHVDTPLL